jgi:cytoskeleton protein RodZ
MYLGLSLGVLVVAAGIAYSWYREHRQAAPLAAAKRATHAAAKAPAPRAEPKVVEAAPVPEPKVQQARIEPPAKVTPARVEPAAEKTAAAKVAVPLAGGSNRVVIRCDDEAWIEVKDANDRMLVSSLNPKGAERVVRSRGPLSLVIGNPEQVHVLHNDRVIDLAPHTRSGVARFTLPLP